MAIYDFPDAVKSDKLLLSTQKLQEEEKALHGFGADQPSCKTKRGGIFSAVAARIFFLLLFGADLLWICYSFSLFTLSLLASFAMGKRSLSCQNLKEKTWLSLKRSLVCGVSLLVTLFSPSFGIMIACTYFLMYDKAGMEEVVPSSLQSQFKEFFPQAIQEEKESSQS